MPQMAPYNWLILFFMFNYIILNFMTHTHFMKSYFFNHPEMKNYKKYFNYTW